MKAEVKEKWLKALRSGNYEQGRFILNNGKGELCCLGVLCEVLELPKKEDQEDGSTIYIVSHNGDDYFMSALLTRPVLNKVGLSHSDQNCLSYLNDRNYSFEDIANFIEENM